MTFQNLVRPKLKTGDFYRFKESIDMFNVDM